MTQAQVKNIQQNTTQYKHNINTSQHYTAHTQYIQCQLNISSAQAQHKVSISATQARPKVAATAIASCTQDNNPTTQARHKVTATVITSRTQHNNTTIRHGATPFTFSKTHEEHNTRQHNTRQHNTKQLNYNTTQNKQKHITAQHNK
jgi:hypothetical protein